MQISWSIYFISFCMQVSRIWKSHLVFLKLPANPTIGDYRLNFLNCKTYMRRREELQCNLDNFHIVHLAYWVKWGQIDIVWWIFYSFKLIMNSDFYVSFIANSLDRFGSWILISNSRYCHQYLMQSEFCIPVIAKISHLGQMPCQQWGLIDPTAKQAWRNLANFVINIG